MDYGFSYFKVNIIIGRNFEQTKSIDYTNISF